MSPPLAVCLWRTTYGDGEFADPQKYIKMSAEAVEAQIRSFYA